MRRLHVLAWKSFTAMAAALLLALAGTGLAQAQTASNCAPAAARGTAPDDFRDYCWLNFEGYSDAQARGTAGQDFQFNLPDCKLTCQLYTLSDDIYHGEPYNIATNA